MQFTVQGLAALFQVQDIIRMVQRGRGLLEDKAQELIMAMILTHIISEDKISPHESDDGKEELDRIHTQWTDIMQS
jgi:vacuolar-type H+-ATPase subunit D/Vma8